MFSMVEKAVINSPPAFSILRPVLQRMGEIHEAVGRGGGWSPAVLSMALKISLKSLRCMGRSFAIASALFSFDPAKIISRTMGSRSAALNILSVRQRPIPSAPNCLALIAASGVSALARTPNVLIPSPQLRSVRRSLLISGSTVGTSPR